jgi:hypothetical protein
VSSIDPDDVPTAVLASLDGSTTLVDALPLDADVASSPHAIDPHNAAHASAHLTARDHTAAAAA